MRGDSSQGLSSPASIHHSPSPILYPSKKREFPDIWRHQPSFRRCPDPLRNVCSKFLAPGTCFMVWDHPRIRMRSSATPLQQNDASDVWGDAGLLEGGSIPPKPPRGRAAAALGLWLRGFPDVQGGEGRDVH